MSKASHCNTTKTLPRRSRLLRLVFVGIVVNDLTEATRRDLPAVLSADLAGVRLEMAYRHFSSAVAAGKRIARAMGLVKVPKLPAWRSRA